MSSECLNLQEVCNKLGAAAVPVNYKELATKEYCLSMGADPEPLAKYGTYECPPDDDIVKKARTLVLTFGGAFPYIDSNLEFDSWAHFENHSS